MVLSPSVARGFWLWSAQMDEVSERKLSSKYLISWISSIIPKELKSYENNTISRRLTSLQRLTVSLASLEWLYGFKPSFASVELCDL
jgi:hypothetical protein